MRASLSLFTLGAIASGALAQKVLPLSFSRGGPGHKGLIKRTGTYSEELNNNLTGGGYYAQVALGTPPQPVTLILDTGSSDVWVLDSAADLCRSSFLQEFYGPCLDSFNPLKSSTYKVAIPDGFDIQYLDGSGAKGDYIKDTLSVGGASIKALQVGLAERSTINSGLLGIGFDTNVAAKEVYRNIIDLFVDEDLIQSKAYSLYLNDLEAETGTVLFGGIDQEKFIGKLKAIDILPDPQSQMFTSFTVSLQSVKIGSGSGSESKDYLGKEILVVLDSGTTLTYLPTTVANKIYRELHAVDDSEGTGLVYIDCDLLKSQKDTTFDFQFGDDSGPIVRVPMHEMVLDNVGGFMDIGLEVPADLPFKNVCSFGIQPMSDYYLLGDTFLRSAYVVYDLDNKQIALAQSNVQATKTRVMEITPSGIPLVSGVASQGPVDQSEGGPSWVSGSGSHHNTTSDDNVDSPAVRVLPAWGVAAAALVGAGLFL